MIYFYRKSFFYLLLCLSEKDNLAGAHQGGVILKENKLHFLCCAKLLQDPNSKISWLNVAFSLGAGPQKILTVTLKFYLTFLKVSPKTKRVLQLVKKRKLNRNLKKYILFTIFKIKNRFAHFWKIKKYLKTFNLEIFGNCSLKYKEGFCKLSKKYINFLGQCDFFKLKLCRVCAARARPNLPIFWN